MMDCMSQRPHGRLPTCWTGQAVYVTTRSIMSQMEACALCCGAGCWYVQGVGWGVRMSHNARLSFRTLIYHVQNSHACHCSWVREGLRIVMNTVVLPSSPFRVIVRTLLYVRRMHNIFAA